MNLLSLILGVKPLLFVYNFRSLLKLLQLFNVKYYYLIFVSITFIDSRLCLGSSCGYSFKLELLGIVCVFKFEEEVVWRIGLSKLFCDYS